ncbi:hypothetical protein RUMOBE_03376 [Blautia obeum ATCC 29174]|jgi:hypothetical protein|uniref:Uncharacterized protein n=1 Tax=Blautia obeum ATCC 29174 TaxID=411459 RepID=A5ZWI3_9FIRM|nr:hypothetical protein RUMOBE_03376 [Blautia obeum ATCC 29174]
MDFDQVAVNEVNSNLIFFPVLCIEKSHTIE